MATMGSRTYSDTSRTNFNRYVQVLWTLTRQKRILRDEASDGSSNL